MVKKIWFNNTTLCPYGRKAKRFIINVGDHACVRICKYYNSGYFTFHTDPYTGYVLCSYSILFNKKLKIVKDLIK